MELVYISPGPIWQKPESERGKNMARSGLPKKYAKMGFARGWKAYKAAKRKAKSAVKRTVKKVTRKRKVTKRKPATGVKKMAKRRTVRKKKSYKRRPRRGLLTGRTANIVIDGATIGAGALGSVFALSKTPWVKDQAAWMKALIAAGIGVAGITLIKQPMAKKLFTGSIVGSAISLALPYMPEGFKFSGGRPLAPAEMNYLRTGKPFVMGKPASIPQPSVAGRSNYRSRTASR